MTENDNKVLSVLAAVYHEWGDCSCMPFDPIAKRSGLDRATVRRSCRRLARKGLASFHKGLVTEDGDLAGSGYCVTEQGLKLANVTESA